MYRIDLSGQRFGKLVVLAFAGHKGDERVWRCQCDCGKESVVPTVSLRHGNTRSCGCLSGEKHGLRRHPLYQRWLMIKQRCENPSDRRYRLYGARGIKVCERWHHFAFFVQDMGPTFQPGLSIERRDNDGDYAPENCVWADQITQCNNSRKNILLEVDGKTMTLPQWAREVGLSQSTIRGRLNLGWSEERAVKTPRLR